METVLRVGFIYVFLLLVLRVMGKRELSQLTPLELVLLLLIPEIVAQGVVREDFSITNAVVAVTTLTSLVFVTSVLSYRFKGFGGFLEGSPSLLVRRGRFLPDEMARERVPPEEIVSEMRRAGVEHLEDVRWAVLEPGGKIAIIREEPGESGSPPEEGDAS